MGQYHFTVNLSKREFVNPHKLGQGLKLGEQLGGDIGIGAALVLLLACSNGRGGGDLCMAWDQADVPLIDGAAEWIGRWAGDQIAIVGDYAQNSDLPAEFEAEGIYGRCITTANRYGTRAVTPEAEFDPETDYRDITDELLVYLAPECGVRFYGNADSWREYEDWPFDRPKAEYLAFGEEPKRKGARPGGHNAAGSGGWPGRWQR